ncbi:MAG: hypothetical protein K2K90_12525 [Lachnospiraceae bacterium]|nr:hypothetical protein [Lachnospiraceae bacterium]
MLMVICLCLVLSNTAFVQTSSAVEATSAEFINSEGNTSYYLEGDRLLKVVTDVPEAVSLRSAMKNTDGTLTSSAEIDIKFYVSVRENSNFLTIISLYTIMKTVCVGLFPRISRVGKWHKRSTCLYTDMLMAIYDEHLDPAYALKA